MNQQLSNFNRMLGLNDSEKEFYTGHLNEN